jgi:hypothetical protein
VGGLDSRRDQRLNADEFLAVVGMPIWTRFYLVDASVRPSPIREQRLLNLCTTLKHNQPYSPAWGEALEGLRKAGDSGVTALLSSDLDFAKCFAAISELGEAAIASTQQLLRRGDDHQRLVATTIDCLWAEKDARLRAILQPDLERTVKHLHPREARKRYKTWLDEIYGRR